MDSVLNLAVDRELEITRAASALMAAKEAETHAKQKRMRAEQLLADIVGIPEEGSKPERATIFKVSVKQPIYRKVDQTKAAIAAEQLGVDSPFRHKFDLDTKAYKTLADHAPDAFAIAAQAVTATPGKVSVSVEEIEGGE